MDESDNDSEANQFNRIFIYISQGMGSGNRDNGDGIRPDRWNSGCLHRRLLFQDR